MRGANRDLRACMCWGEDMLTMTIPRRFRGPPNSGNGGYVCGMLARNIAGAAEVTLRAPPPLETALDASSVTVDAAGAALSRRARDLARSSRLGAPRSKKPLKPAAHAGKAADQLLPMCPSAVLNALGGSPVRRPLSPHDTTRYVPCLGARPRPCWSRRPGCFGVVRSALDCPTVSSATTADRRLHGRRSLDASRHVRSRPHLVTMRGILATGRRRSASQRRGCAFWRRRKRAGRGPCCLDRRRSASPARKHVRAGDPENVGRFLMMGFGR